MILVFLLHVFFATVLAYGLVHIFSSLQMWIVVFSLSVGLIVAIFAARELHERRSWRLFAFSENSEQSWMEIAISCFILYAAARHFAWMLFPMEFHLATLSQTNLGDLPLHVNFIRTFAAGSTFPVRNPIFAADLLRYPYGVDLYNALWEKLGLRLQAGLFLTGIGATLASLVALRRYGGWWAIGAFFLSGGLAGWQTLNGAPLLNYQDASIDWKNLFLAVFITQRGMLFALPLGLLLIERFRSHFTTEQALTQREAVILGLIWGFLPLFHLHAFLIVSVTIASIAVFERKIQNPQVRVARILSFLKLRSFQIAFLPALFFILYSTDFFRAAHVAHWHWLWTRESQNIWTYLSWNFGPWLLLPPALALALSFSGSRFTAAERRRLWAEFFVTTILWLLFFNLILAPWEWDNIKVLIWPYLGFARLGWLLIDPLLGRYFGPFERPAIGLVLFFSGAIAIGWTLQSPLGQAQPIYGFGTLASTEGALANVPIGAVFAAAPTYQHPLTYFGRMRAIGYNGHIWSHGIDGRATYQALEQIMRGDENWLELARTLGISHIFWGPDERLAYGGDRKRWMSVLKNVSRVDAYAIYQVQ